MARRVPDKDQHHVKEANAKMSETRVNPTIEADPLEPAERARSDFVRDMVQRREGSTVASATWASPTPKRIVQF